ncbi:hypothetical protein EHQ53_11735 [Leptospira langatensis]|uniref:Uncharacterized protein n=1 Tax=Leptospira langatensis TaxID=2484983 RepID=A0A5F1ZS91_9LEPT|nr:hypothetical protein [Leptospira langatensis]TGJ98785.1 hypothetical protein EHO57_14765 [Leptospira langatensis]TGL40648.1 hypothetical protein EHQ53_11735 [Leptospira langatensis]
MKDLGRILVLILLLSPVTLSPGELKYIHLKSGKIVIGIIVEETETYIQVRMENGLFGKLEKRFIEKIGTEKPKKKSEPEPSGSRIKREPDFLDEILSNPRRIRN